MRHMPPNAGNGGNFLPMIVHGVFSLLILAAVITFAIILIKKLRTGTLQVPSFARPTAPSVDNDPYLSALKLLNERLVKGEIDVDEYYARRTALKGPDPTTES